jgi:uroporphyrinogen III methyltransferase/synthase
VACIGPQTAATAREFGLRSDVEPEVAAVDALVDALAAYAVARRESGDATPPPKKSRRASSTTRTAR